MVRVAGTDPGSSSLDVIVLVDGSVDEQHRFHPDELGADPATLARWLAERGPFDLIAGPSGYGLPLINARDCAESNLALMTLVRPDDHDRRKAVAGFSAVVRALCRSGLPVVFLPGVIHLPTVPSHRKINRIDLGTADKLCVAALALQRYVDSGIQNFGSCTACLIELGTAFTACLVLAAGQVVDAAAGTAGPLGWQSGGAWDGEAAYLLSPLSKNDLFTGGVSSTRSHDQGRALFAETLLKAVAGLQAVTPFQHLVLSGRLLEMEPEWTTALASELGRLGTVTRLDGLPGAWVKHAAQGAALLADGLAGGSNDALVGQLRLREAAGTVLDWLPREIRSKA
jgi:predicted butyrate kinase (DUF1464 family)